MGAGVPPCSPARVQGEVRAPLSPSHRIKYILQEFCFPFFHNLACLMLHCPVDLHASWKSLEPPSDPAGSAPHGPCCALLTTHPGASRARSPENAKHTRASRASWQTCTPCPPFPPALQVFILDSLSTYKCKEPKDAERIAERVMPRLQHANAAVVLSAVKVCVALPSCVQKPWRPCVRGRGWHGEGCVQGVHSHHVPSASCVHSIPHSIFPPALPDSTASHTPAHTCMFACTRIQMHTHTHLTTYRC